MAAKSGHGVGCYTMLGPCLSIEKEREEDELGLEKQEGNRDGRRIRKKQLRFEEQVSAAY